MLNKLNIRKIFKEIIIFILSVFVISLVINFLRSPEINQSCLKYLKGKTIHGKDLSEFKNHYPLILHFWGTWCPICRQEASNIDIVAKKYNLLTIAVDSGSDEEIKTWLKKRDLSFPVFNDKNGKLARKFKIKIFPTTIIFDKEGKIKFIESGYTTTLGLISRIKLAD